MKRAIALLVLATSGYVQTETALAQKREQPKTTLRNRIERRQLNYDRIQALERFIKTVYPDLATRLAMFDIEASFEEEGHVHVRHISFYPCKSESGAGGERMAPTAIPLAPQKALAPQPPNCFNEPTPEFEHFLDIYVDLGGGYQERPIWKFQASGSYVDQQLQDLLKDFSGNPSRASEMQWMLYLQKSLSTGQKTSKLLSRPFR